MKFSYIPEGLKCPYCGHKAIEFFQKSRIDVWDIRECGSCGKRIALDAFWRTAYSFVCNFFIVILWALEFSFVALIGWGSFLYFFYTISLLWVPLLKRERRPGLNRSRVEKVFANKLCCPSCGGLGMSAVLKASLSFRRVVKCQVCNAEITLAKDMEWVSDIFRSVYFFLLVYAVASARVGEFSESLFYAFVFMISRAADYLTIFIFVPFSRPRFPCN